MNSSTGNNLAKLNSVPSGTNDCNIRFNKSGTVDIAGIDLLRLEPCEAGRLGTTMSNIAYVSRITLQPGDELFALVGYNTDTITYYAVSIY